jgi:hypothetical protein
LLDADGPAHRKAARGEVHEWAAIEATQVFPVDARLSLTMIRVVIALALALVVLLVFLPRS